MLTAIILCFVISTVQGHTDKLKSDADLQSALMPQELNPAFVSDKDSPLRAFLPLERIRRETDLIFEPTPVSLVKKYSRIVACVVLGLSAATEIVLYFIESYYGG